MSTFTSLTADGLHIYGMVNLTGLTVPAMINYPYDRVVMAENTDHGKWNCTRMMTVAVTDEGQIWVCAGPYSASLLAILRRICAKGRDQFAISGNEYAITPALLLGLGTDLMEDHNRFIYEFIHMVRFHSLPSKQF